MHAQKKANRLLIKCNNRIVTNGGEGRKLLRMAEGYWEMINMYLKSFDRKK